MDSLDKPTVQYSMANQYQFIGSVRFKGETIKRVWSDRCASFDRTSNSCFPISGHIPSSQFYRAFLESRSTTPAKFNVDYVGDISSSLHKQDPYRN